MKINKLLFYLFYFALIAIAFSFLFSWQLVNGGDYTMLTSQQVIIWKNVSFLAWDTSINLGWSIIPLLSYSPYSWFIGLLGSIVGNNGVVIERVVWWIPFITLGFFGSLFLSRKLLKDSLFSFLGPLLFLFNTYILMIIGGGQIAGVGLAYALSPFLLYTFFELFEKPNLKESIFSGVILALSITFDLRVTYIILIGIGVKLVVKAFFDLRNNIKDNFKHVLALIGFIGVAGLISFFLHAFWLLPQLIVRQNPLTQLGAAYSSLGAVKFFSFAKFENAIGLLHPNWPENIFGLTHFMKPEFLLLPFLAFGSLLIVKQSNDFKKNRYILYFAFLSLIGAFLAKGANEPFGNIYLWCFQHVPGFIMFRDSSKFYVLVALSYSVLIPFALQSFLNTVSNSLNARSKSVLHTGCVIGFVVFFLFLIRPLFMGQLTGVFRSHEFPKEYTAFNTFLNSQKSYSRTLWIPVKQRFGFYSSNHPIVVAGDFFHTARLSGVLDMLHGNSAEEKLRDVGIKYVIVPYDSEGEIFLKDRKYNNASYEDTVKRVAGIPWLHEISGFGRIHVFEVPNPKDHFWSSDMSLGTSYRMISPVEYIVNVRDAKIGEKIVFAESFDPLWQATVNGKVISSVEYSNINSFILPKDGSYSFKVFYNPQEWVNIGLWISGITVLGIGVFFLRQCFALHKNFFKKKSQK